jgi:photosystem II stability/assembly factor-like uncharacterized protein
MSAPPKLAFHFRKLAALLLTAAVLLIGLAAAMAIGRHREADVDIAERLTVDQLLAKINTIERHPTGSLRALASGTLNWTSLGPQPVTNEYWSGNANASGRASSIVMDPTDSNTLYIATAGGGVWKTSDGGSTWAPLTDQLSSLASGALAIDPQNPGTVLYGTGEQHYSGDSFYGDGLFRTTDGGNSWTKIGLKTQVGNYIARVGLSTGTLHVCSDLGYVRSVDDGTTWTAFRPGGAQTWCNDLVQSAQAPGTWFAGFYGTGIYKSIDDGVTWALLTGGLPSSGFLRVNLGTSDGNANVVYASLINQPGGLFGMYKTTDGGTTWSRLSSTPNYVCTQGWYDNTVAVSPTDPNIVFAAGVFTYCGGGIIKSTDGGTTWTNVSVGSDGSQVHPDQHYIVFAPDGSLWVTSDGGVWESTTAGSTWVNLNQGLGTALLYTVAIHPTDSNFLVAGTQDNGSVQYQGGTSWPEVIGGDGGPAAVEWANPDQYYTTYVNLEPLYRWLRPLIFSATVTGPWSGERASWANGPLVVDPNVPNTLMAGTFRLWRTTNSGASWSSISPDLTGGGNGVLRALAMAPTDSNTMYSGSSDGQVHATSNGGATWPLRSAGLPAGKTVPDIVVSPTDPLTAYLCVDQPSGGRLFQTSDGGVTWQDETGSLPAGLRGMSLAIDFTNSVFYLGTDYGVYSTPDSGVTWTQEAINLPSVPVYNVRIDTLNALIVAATHGRGMWSAPLTSGM